MPKIDKKFPVDLLNTDDAPHTLPEGAAVNMRNLRLHTSIDGRAGYFENILRNLKLSGQDGKIPVGSERIASYEDPAGKFVIWFTHKDDSPGDDQINYYDLETGTYWLVAKSELGVYGDIGTGLGFRFGIFYDLDFANGILYWVSQDHEPRKIHIGAGIMSCNPTLDITEVPFYEGWRYDWLNTGDDDTSIENLSLIVKPGGYPPMIAKRVDTTVNQNNILGESYQFATMHKYYSKEESVLSGFSTSSLINSDAEKGNNVIDVSLNPLEYPLPQGLKEVRLYVKVASTQKMFLIKTWKREDIDAGGLLSYSFYGSYFGSILDGVATTEPFHSVPEEAETIEIIKNRIHLGKTKEGKDTPETTSMVLTLGEAVEVESIESVRKKLQSVMYRGKRVNGLSRPRFYYSGLYVKLDEVPEPGYYLIPGTEIRMGSGFTGIPAVFAPVPASVNVEDLIFKGKTLPEIIEATRSVTIANLYESYINESPVVTVEVVGLLTTAAVKATPLFLHYSSLNGAMGFFDRYLRKCGAVTNDDIRVSIPVRNFALSTGYNDVKWSVNNIAPLSQIPDWAVYYAPLRSRNSRTNSFLSGYSGETRYARIDPETAGGYLFDDPEEPGDDSPYLQFTAATAGIGIDTTSLLNAGLGYTYTKGDQCILIGEDNVAHYLTVLGIYGKYILLAAKDLGDLTDTQFVYDVYTPFKIDTNDSYYEVGQMFPIINPGTDDRKFSTMSGSFLPDTYVLPRKNGIESAYLAYAMSPNDLYWERWDTHFGRSNVVTDLGARVKDGNISHSDVFIPGTNVNGLSAFHATNEVNLPQELGALRKLQSTSKVQGEGDVLLAVCEAGTASLYIGESELFDQNGNSFLAKSDKVIGQINPLKGGFGTRHPESVKEVDGQVFWYDQLRRAFVRYSSNGLFDISDYKFKRITYALSKQVELAESDGSLVLINGGIDPYFKEYLVQKKVYTPDVVSTCPIPTTVTITADPTLENPEKVIASWNHAEENTEFQYMVVDQNGYPVLNGSGFFVDNPATLDILGLLIGVPYTFRLRTRCGGSSFSQWVDATIYIDGVEEPAEPGDGCVGVSLAIDPSVLPDAIVGERYERRISFNGSIPINISDITKPDWLYITVEDRDVVFVGDPIIDDLDPAIVVSFTLSNCFATPLFFNDVMKVILP